MEAMKTWEDGGIGLRKEVPNNERIWGYEL